MGGNCLHALLLILFYVQAARRVFQQICGMRRHFKSFWRAFDLSSTHTFLPIEIIHPLLIDFHMSYQMRVSNEMISVWCMGESESCLGIRNYPFERWVKSDTLWLSLKNRGTMEWHGIKRKTNTWDMEMKILNKSMGKNFKPWRFDWA